MGTEFGVVGRLLPLGQAFESRFAHRSCITEVVDVARDVKRHGDAEKPGRDDRRLSFRDPLCNRQHPQGQEER